MKRISTVLATLVLVAFSASAVSAADLRAAPAYKGPPIMAPYYYNWTGFYVGAHIGGAWAHKDWSYPDIPATGGSHTADGILGGVQVGFNWQTGPWVLGAEAQFSWADLKGSNSDLFFAGFTDTTKVDFLGSVAGRIGYAWDNWMLYVKGGGAWARDKYTTASAGLVQTASETRWGWMVGTGIEYGLTPAWSVKLEYNYMDFGSDRVLLQPGSDSLDVDQRIHLVKAGINYRFGGKAPAPVVTRY